MTSQEIREKFIAFFKEKNHAVIPSASLIPENDSSALFITAGMQPLVPFLLGEKHPQGKRLVNVQKCLRTDDIEEVGDAQHLTFFEMLGYWSLGDYFKKESIYYTFEFFTNVLGFDKNNISVTIFAGDDKSPFDQESYDTWKDEIGISEERIYRYGKKENWWGPVGETGPCGPCTEMFIDTGIKACSKDCGPSCKCDKFIEIGNNVFMEYNKIADGKFEKLVQKNVDVGLGLERLVMISQSKKTIFEIDLFEPIIKKIEELTGKKYEESEKAFRVIADHIKAATFIFTDGVEPSNMGKGYVLRRLIRRSVRYSWMLDFEDSLFPVVEKIIEIYKDVYPELANRSFQAGIKREEEKFRKAISEGLKKAKQIFSAKTPIPHEEFAKIMQLEDKGDILGKIYASPPSEEIDDDFQKAGIKITNNEIHKAYVLGQEAFNLYQTNGFPIELIVEMAQETNLFVDINGFKAELAKHQELSRTASAGMFKGGLADSSEETVKLHTAAHLLLAALQQVLEGEVTQKGSNITAERLRFDFSHPQKLTNEEIKKVEELVNQKIKDAIAVTMEEMSLDEAKKSGAHGTFSDRYGDRVKVYTINNFSKEICGGPHVKNTSELGSFKIIKEEASSAGVRRIKATLK